MARLPRVRPLILLAWLAAALLAGRFFLADILYALEHGGWRSAPATLLGRDFVNLVTAGHLVIDQKLSLIYDVAAYQQFQSVLFDGRVGGHNYSYSPVSFFYAPLFAIGGYGLAYALWIGITGFLFALAARPYLRGAGLPAWLALLVPAGLVNIWAGHYGFLFGALWLGAWRLIDSRPRTAGVLIGLMIVKPHLAVLMPIVLLRRGAWSAIASAAATAGGLVLLSGLVFGWDYWITYLTETSALQATMVAESNGFFVRMMPTVYPSMLLAGLGWSGAVAAQAVVAIAAIAALWKWLPADPLRAGLAAASATFLVLPYAFNYDMTVIGIAALIALYRTASDASPVARYAPVLAFLLPLLVVSLNQAGVPAAPFILGLFLAVQLAEGRQAAVTPPRLLQPA
jgi:alpha-1,2-mannosyltransferase